MIALDIISDPICPWCYIGKTRLDRAIAQAGHNPFTPRWRMFRLNPDMPEGGMDRRAYLEAKFGGPDGAARVYDRIAEMAKADGMDLDLDGITRTPQTLDAHRVIRWAENEGAQTAVVDALFKAYFEEREDIGDQAVLTRIAGEAGMDSAVVQRLLASDADRAAIEEEESAAREMGVTGVPCFVIQGRYVVQGAQDVETWVRIIDEIGDVLAQKGREAAHADEIADGGATP